MLFFCCSQRADLSFNSLSCLVSSDLLYVAKTDRTDKLFCTRLIKSTSGHSFQRRRSFKVRNTVQLTYLCRGHVWAGWCAPGPLRAKLGAPLHPITAGERLVGQWWAAGFVTLAVTVCDPGGGLAGCWLTKRPEREPQCGDRGGKWAGEGAVYDRNAGGRRKKKGGTRKRASAAAQAGRRPTEADAVCWFGDSDAPGGLFIKRSHGQMWFLQRGRQVEEVFVYRSLKCWLEMHSFASLAAVLGVDRGCAVRGFHMTHCDVK